MNRHSIAFIALLLASCSQPQQNAANTPLQPPASASINPQVQATANMAQVQPQLQSPANLAPNLPNPSGQWVLLTRGTMVPAGTPPFDYYGDPSYKINGQYRYFWTKTVSDYPDSIGAKYDLEYDMLDCNNQAMTRISLIAMNQSTQVISVNNNPETNPSNQMMINAYCR